MNCKICNTTATTLFKAKVMHKYQVQYYQCPNCFFVQTEKEYWLKEAYTSALNVSDTGILYRNRKLFEKTFSILVSNFGKKGKYIDYGGGYGIFVRTMRDAGLDYYWQDIYAANLCARGFEYDPNTKYDALSTFEVFEHLVDPIEEIEQMFKLADTIIFSTEIISDTPPSSNEWWYYGLEHGQHIALYSKKSLEIIGDKFGAQLYTDGRGFHALSKKKLSNFSFILKLSKIGLPYILKTQFKTKYYTDHLTLSQKYTNSEKI
ncbi:MAG: class I SAM-dependent methyltransferase [Bacteroidota bacterium]|nr:class I SAM-dependent methyltransferase [Bacteroidota bacterium]